MIVDMCQRRESWEKSGSSGIAAIDATALFEVARSRSRTPRASEPEMSDILA